MAFNSNLNENSVKIEHVLGVDNFKNSAKFTGLYSLGALIQTLLLTEPKTYPSNPEIGVGIELYSFEAINEQMINTLRREIKLQINTFIPNVYLEEVIIQKIENENSNVNSLGIMVIVNNKSSSDNIVILLNQNSKTSKVVSKVIV
jgi:hypothetical protein